MSTVLVTGFEPFADFRENPSRQVAEQLHGRTIGGASVESLILPVAFGQDTEKLFPVIEDRNPRLVLSLGLSPQATCLHIERIALNLRRGDGEKRETSITPMAPLPISPPSTSMPYQQLFTSEISLPNHTYSPAPSSAIT